MRGRLLPEVLVFYFGLLISDCGFLMFDVGYGDDGMWGCGDKEMMR
ncbi:MAG: hypothetical protein IPH84_04060 [Bacteroidales bacterium]|nr:hypothetical protein [Bacteroidales bacterium]